MHNGDLQIVTLGKPHIHYRGESLTSDRIAQKGQALLIYLAVTGRAYSRSALAGLLWGEMPEETARANLRLSLTKLRKILPDTILITSRQEVGLAAANLTLDVASLQRREASQPVQAILDLYQGDFLADFYLPNAPDFEAWAGQQRAYWRQTALTTLTRFLPEAIAVQAWEPGLAAAHKLLTIEPWHEEGHRYLMHLLALSGQRSAALAQYETCRRLLAEELGVAPGRETVALYERIRDDKVTGRQGDRVQQEVPSPRHPVVLATPHNLPVQLTPFIGRETELKQLTEQLQQPDYRLLTILGEGGVGKTRLALAAAAQVHDHFPDGVWFVSLVGLEAVGSDPLTLENNIATAIAAALDTLFATGEPPKTQLSHYLRSKQCLLLLDNFEPLVAAAGLVLDLLTTTPGLTVLITSREPLYLQAERIVRVTGFPLPESAATPDALQADGIRFFAERAERTAGKPVVTPDTLPDVIRLCHFVNGLPLGIELLASWTRWLSLPDIWRGLQANEVRLEAHLPDVAARHRSMQAVFDYSWELLHPDEQALLAQLSVFRRSFQLEAVRQVVGANPATLFALVDKSLVQHQDEGYYGLHDLLRQYAAAQLTALSLDKEALADRHAHYYLHLAGQQENLLVGPQPHVALRRMQADSENLAQAWQWAVTRPLPEVLAAGVGGMANYWNYAGLDEEGQQVLARAAAAIQSLLNPNAPQSDLSRLLARLTAERAGLLYDLSRLDEMAAEAQVCLHWAQLADDAILAAHGHLRLGQAYWRRGGLEPARTQLQTAYDLVANRDQTALEATIWRSQAVVAWKLNDIAMAQEASHRSLRCHQAVSDIRGENRTRHFLGILALETQDYEAVHTYLEPVLQSAHTVGERRLEMGAYALLGQVAGYQGHYEQALAYLAQERALAEELNMRWQMGSNASNMGDVYLRLGDYTRAQSSYERALAVFRQVKSDHAESNILAFMGLLACLQERHGEGLSHCTTALHLAQLAQAHREQAFAHLFGAHNLVGLGRWQEAGQSYEQAQMAWQTLGQRMRAVEAQAGRAKAALRLGDEAEAVKIVDEVLAYLDANGADGADDPARVFVTCYEVLRQAGDDRAETVRARGRSLLQTRANRIAASELRHVFLGNNPSHRTLLKR